MHVKLRKKFCICELPGGGLLKIWIGTCLLRLWKVDPWFLPNLAETIDPLQYWQPQILQFGDLKMLNYIQAFFFSVLSFQ